MSPLTIILLSVIGVLLCIFLTALVCFYITFYVSKKEKQLPVDVAKGKIYDPFHATMKQWMNDTKTLPFTPYTITAQDGTKLYGKYYECKAGAPIELMMHGYRGRAERDLCGGIARCFSIGHNALLVDQRASGNSGGQVITFGAKESLDCLDWVQHLCRTFGNDVPIMLTGISMGASTVLTAASHPLPQNVVGVLADCGFTSAKDIICKIIREKKLPQWLYGFVRLGAILFGNFDPDKASAVNAMPHCKVPVIFFHGTTDSFVPCEMSVENYNACAAPKKLVLTENAGHGLCYLVNPEGYLSALTDFCKENDIPVNDTHKS